MNFKDAKSKIYGFNHISRLYDKDYEFEDFINFLDETSEGTTPMIINGNGIWLYSLIVPKDNLKEEFIDELLEWDIYYPSYGYYRNKEGYFLSKPYEDCEPEEILKDSIPLFFQREVFEQTERHTDLNQQIAHVLDLGKKDQSKDYYKLKKGDFVKVVEVDEDKISIHSIDKEELDKFLSISNSIVIRFFVNSLQGNGFSLDTKEKTIKDKDRNIYYKFIQNTASESSVKYIRGIQIIDFDREFEDDEIETEFEAFLIKDFDSGESFEYTCNPNMLSNMFKKEDYPHDLTMVFFDKEVMNTYRMDSEKYIITDRSINCRGYWYLPYFISCDKSQVIVYLCDLGNLPNEVQKRWKRYNEEPHSDIPDHVMKNDFEGEWHDYIDPLKLLKKIVRDFPTCTINYNITPIWVEKNKGSIRSLDDIRYLQEGTKDEWECEINKLYQIFVEGFQKSNINKIAEHFQCSEGSNKSINNLRKCLNAIGVKEVIVNTIVEPLEELNAYRNNVDHIRNKMTYPAELPEQLIEIYNELIRKLLYSFAYLSRIIKEGKFDF